MSTKTFFVKTRNWYCRKWVKIFLDLSHLWGVQRGDSYTDGDGKYYLETDSRAAAIATFLYFLALSPLTGGWTYIVDQKRYPDWNSIINDGTALL